MPKKSSKFVPGVSGCPAGRPKGIVDSRNALRVALAADLPAVIAAIVAAAKKGDMQACALVLSRCLSPMKAQSPLVELPALAKARTATERARAVVDAVAVGALTSDAALDILSALANCVRIEENDSLVARIAALEGAAIETR